MNPLLTHFGESASGPAALGINGQSFLIQLITFILVFLVLRQFAFKPIVKLLNDRHDLIEQGVTLGEKMRVEEAKLADKAAATLQDARQKADRALADADTAARQKVAAAEEVAQKRAEAIVAEAESQVKQASARERKRLEGELIGLVSEVSEAVIHEKVDAKKDATLVAAALKDRGAA